MKTELAYGICRIFITSDDEIIVMHGAIDTTIPVDVMEALLAKHKEKEKAEYDIGGWEWV